eukprot:CAMPEP_0194499162 /NCGR_PEP_ID=MMETSP0253-20130528/15560_1 /TAXON_ID=2966 /ORGANISM="Noctiluca scintillans" /LENGTH=134 /DNA_ID=CAMNT_0039340891 /DNA_START=45 /DNA_END=449 /DNA_ORIENTATION=-
MGSQTSRTTVGLCRRNGKVRAERVLETEQETSEVVLEGGEARAVAPGTPSSSGSQEVRLSWGQPALLHWSRCLEDLEFPYCAFDEEVSAQIFATVHAREPERLVCAHLGHPDVVKCCMQSVEMDYPYCDYDTLE